MRNMYEPLSNWEMEAMTAEGAVPRNTDGDPLERTDCDLCGKPFANVVDAAQDLPGDRDVERFLVHHECCNRLCATLEAAVDGAQIGDAASGDRFVAEVIRAAQKARAK